MFSRIMSRQLCGAGVRLSTRQNARSLLSNGTALIERNSLSISRQFSSKSPLALSLLNANRSRSFSSIKTLRNIAATGAKIIDEAAIKMDATGIPLAAKDVKTSKYVAYWLIGTSGLVFGIVILGGLTRLTESGLSITEWRPILGALPPLSQAEWEEEFAKYRESPEFMELNSHINLDEFKFIFFMEWFHRLWGRAIGGIFVLPALYFVVTKKTSGHVNKRLLFLSGLLGLQGFVGWWMVKSGLDKEQLEARQSKPTVSQYRLTTHLGAAFLLYMGMLWTGWEILRELKWLKNPAKALEAFKKLESSNITPIRKVAIALTALTFITAMSGGMVAGLDAGLVYPTFPQMGEHIIPPSRELFEDRYARKEDKSDKWWRNMLENPVTVQLNHRILATVTFAAILAAHIYCNKRKYIVPRNADITMKAMMGVLAVQVTLGALAVLYYVPISIASMHQGGALALLTLSLLFAAQLRAPRLPIRNTISKLHQQQLKAGSKIIQEASKQVLR
ncbi:Cytochrome c oxidase assembly protein COX15 [Nakaseomyces bracarensis]|uniref:Cytochrome c oxidase assembly protein COX15 n=1 Tax=Nakaseomyces bracarensis TaxID=273131 RepID=A0ABR4NZM1_9SACH